MTPAYHAPPPHPIVYSATPVTSMPTVQQESDEETTGRSRVPYYPTAYVVPMNAPCYQGQPPYPPQQFLVPAPVSLTR
ncbi:hypothetical protein Aduo_005532 [Ancylostoma duodenale]